MLAIFGFMACPPLRSDEETARAIQSQYNAAIESIVDEILKVRNGYPELEGFSKSVISVDANGFDRVFYTHGSASGVDSYAYQLSINPTLLDTEVFVPADASTQEIKFPLLGFKVVVESPGKGESTSFDYHKIVLSNMERLNVLEQEFLPFRLKLQAQKESFRVYEDIAITAILQNVGQKAYQVADLGENSMYCQIGQSEWGEPQGSPDLNRVLNSGASLAKILKVYGFDTPQELWISCTYAIAYRGVQPYDRIKVAIIPRS